MFNPLIVVENTSHKGLISGIHILEGWRTEGRDNVTSEKAWMSDNATMKNFSDREHHNIERGMTKKKHGGKTVLYHY